MTASAAPLTIENGSEQRRQPRRRVAAMYSLLRAKTPEDSIFRFTGHIYDVSMSGMRFELDAPLEPGTTLNVRCVLPGLDHAMFRALGRVVRIHDDDQDAAGPVRMGMAFEEFQSDIDRQRLAQYLSHSGLAAAA